MERVKMHRADRAKQFAPFDALKGLHEMLRMKEYEHERGVKGDLPEEKIEEISKIILELEKNDLVDLTYFVDGYYKTISGNARVDVVEQVIKVGGLKVPFDDIFDLKKIS